MKRFLWCVGIAVAVLAATGTAGADDVIWGGGNGAWNSANWNGSQTAYALFGRNNGVRNLSDVYINSGTVTYDPNTYGDFHYRGGGTLNIGSGAVFTFDTTDAGAPDGYWTEFDADALNIDGGTFDRGVSGGGTSGGPMILGSWGDYAGQQIAINVTGGGNFVNDGQVWFGCPDDNEPGLGVVMTINDGTVDLTGGNRYTEVGDYGTGMTNDDELYILQDLAFCYGHDGTSLKGETYAINFTGPGTFIVDNGIIAPVQSATPGPSGSGAWTTNVLGGGANDLLSYEDLWDAGILQANGVSGLDGATFSSYFTVTGAKASPNYTLTSSVVNLVGGDLNSDGMVTSADLDIVRSNWGQSVTPGCLPCGDANGDGSVNSGDLDVVRANWGTGVGAASCPVVPEPGTLFLLLAGALGLLLRRR